MSFLTRWLGTGKKKDPLDEDGPFVETDDAAGLFMAPGLAPKRLASTDEPSVELDQLPVLRPLGRSVVEQADAFRVEAAGEDAEGQDEPAPPGEPQARGEPLGDAAPQGDAALQGDAVPPADDAAAPDATEGGGPRIVFVKASDDPGPRMTPVSADQEPPAAPGAAPGLPGQQPPAAAAAPAPQAEAAAEQPAAAPEPDAADDDPLGAFKTVATKSGVSQLADLVEQTPIEELLTGLRELHDMLPDPANESEAA